MYSLRLGGGAAGPAQTALPVGRSHGTTPLLPAGTYQLALERAHSKEHLAEAVAA